MTSTEQLKALAGQLAQARELAIKEYMAIPDAGYSSPINVIVSATDAVAKIAGQELAILQTLIERGE